MLPFTWDEIRAATACSFDFRAPVGRDLGRADRVLRLLRTGRFSVEADRPHYGSGTASYRDFFCFRRPSKKAVADHAAQRRPLTIGGVCLYVSELLPAATWSYQERVHTYRLDEHGKPILTSFGHDFLSPTNLLQLPPRDWNDVDKAIWRALSSEQLHVLGSDELARPLPTDLSVDSWLPSLSGRPRLTVFDAIFFWAD